MLPWLLCAALAAAVLILCVRLLLLHRAMDELRAQLAAPGVELLLADPDCFPLAPASLRRIALPNPGSMSVVENFPALDLVGGRLDRWLDEALKEGIEK